MPELPEVETTKRKLEPLILGKRILLARRSFGEGGDLGRKILKLERRGKAILIYLSGGKILGFHQRMSGKLLIIDPPKAGAFRRASKHIRRRFRLSSGKELIFHDVRKFGVVWYGPAKKVLADKFFKSLGPDALSVSYQKFKSLINSKKGKIKPFLLNQKNLAGVGNIIADEVLWKAKIHPSREVRSLNKLEVRNLHKALKFILKKSIKLGGTTMRDWFHPEGTRGAYFEKRYVYDREDGQCFRCGSKISRKKIGGRSSYHCPRCQTI